MKYMKLTLLLVLISFYLYESLSCDDEGDPKSFDDCKYREAEDNCCYSEEDQSCIDTDDKCQCPSENHYYNSIRKDCIYYPPDAPNCDQDWVNGNIDEYKNRKPNGEDGYCCLVHFREDDYYHDENLDEYFGYKADKFSCVSLSGNEYYDLYVHSDYVEQYNGRIFEIICPQSDGDRKKCIESSYNETTKKCEKKVGYDSVCDEYDVCDTNLKCVLLCDNEHCSKCRCADGFKYNEANQQCIAIVNYGETCDVDTNNCKINQQCFIYFIIISI